MKKIRRGEWADLVFVLAFVLGAFLRFNPTLLAGFHQRWGNVRRHGG
jgi:hypothetical protein